MVWSPEGGAVFDLQFDRGKIPELAGRYSYPAENVVESIAHQNKGRGFLLRPEFLTLCQWKTERSKSRVARNSDSLIQEATNIALTAKNEPLRISPLLALHGVGWPTASVILHFWHTEPYPILDFRALWSLGLEKPPAVYNFEFWWTYTQFCRTLSKECRVSMRELDRALWQYSSEEQTASSRKTHQSKKSLKN